MRTIIAGLLLLMCSKAEAARYCADPQELAKNTRDCSDNEYFSGAAVECLEKLEKAIEVGKGAVSAGAAANAAQSKASQKGKQKNSMLDYHLSKATLDSLIAQAKQAQAETAVYFDSVVWPEDFDEPKITGPNLQAYLDSDPCYKDNRDMIANVLNDFDTYIAQLEEARDASDALEKATKSNEGNLNSLGAEPVKAGGKNIGAPGKVTKSGKSKNSQSDVTGIEEDKARQKKK